MTMLHQRRPDGNEKNEDHNSSGSISLKPMTLIPGSKSSPNHNNTSLKHNSNTSSLTATPHNPSIHHKPRADSSISSYEFGDDDEYSSDGDENKTLLAVPAIENVVMGGGDTVIDEEHYVPVMKKNSSFGDLLAMAGGETRAVPSVTCLKRCFEGSRAYRWWNTSLTPWRRTVIMVGSYAMMVMILYHFGMDRTTVITNKTFYGRAMPGENELLRDPPDQKEGMLMTFPGVPPPSGVRLPKELNERLANVYDPPTAMEIPLFWHVPRSGGETVQDIMGFCLELVQASDVGGKDVHVEDKELEVVSLTNGRYVNVDTSTYIGIKRAQKLSLAQSNLPDVIVSRLPLPDISSLFSTTRQARLFTLLRHPVERIISVFHHRGWAHWDEQTYDPTLTTMSIEEYANEPRIEHNWMVRFLSGRQRGPISFEHLDVAKRILSQKCLVGLLERKEETLRRYEHYLRWRIDSDKKRNCVEKLMLDTWSNRHDHPKLDRTSPAWELLTIRNRFDIELYEFAKRLFNEQRGLFD